MGLQVFGTRKCQDTKKGQRFLKERGVAFQFIDLADTGISPGELRSIAQSIHAGLEGFSALMDSESPRFKDRGLVHMDFDPEEELLRDPLLLKTPILRDGKMAVIGFRPESWKALLSMR
jgi:arsenate reductase (glutaredoxin)